MEFVVTRPRRHYWLVLEPEEVSVCLHDPGLATDVVVTSDVATLYDLYLGRAEVRVAVRNGTVTIEGPSMLVRAFPRWFRWSSFAPAVRRGLARAGTP